MLKLPPKVLTGDGDDDNESGKLRVAPNPALFEAFDLFVVDAMSTTLDNRVLDLVYSQELSGIPDVFVAHPSDALEGKAIRLGLKTIVTNDEGDTGYTGDWSYVDVTPEVAAAYLN